MPSTTATATRPVVSASPRCVTVPTVGRGDAGRAGHGPSLQVDGEPVLGEVPGDRGRGLALDAVADAGVVQLPDELARAVSGLGRVS